MVLTALEEAKPVLTSPTEPISKILKRIMQEVCQLKKKQSLEQHKQSFLSNASSWCNELLASVKGFKAAILKLSVLQIAKADSEAGVSTGWVLDNFPTTMLHLKALQEDQVSPDMLFCLTDSEEKNGTKHWNGAGGEQFRFWGLNMSVLFVVCL